MVEVEKGKQIRIASLKNSGPFQDLLDVLELQANETLKEVLHACGHEDIYNRQQRAVVAHNLVDSLRRMVDSYHREHNPPGPVVL